MKARTVLDLDREIKIKELKDIKNYFYLDFFSIIKKY